jgi:hypothetical protein
MERNQLGRKAGKAIRYFRGETVLQDNILAFDITEITHALPYRTEIDFFFFLVGTVPKYANARSMLLSSREPRQCDHTTAADRDEFPSPHDLLLSQAASPATLPDAGFRMIANSVGQVRLGSKAVRFRPSKCLQVCALKQTQGICEYTNLAVYS